MLALYVQNFKWDYPKNKKYKPKKNVKGSD